MDDYQYCLDRKQKIVYETSVVNTHLCTNKALLHVRVDFARLIAGNVDTPTPTHALAGTRTHTHARTYRHTHTHA